MISSLVLGVAGWCAGPRFQLAYMICLFLVTTAVTAIKGLEVWVTVASVFHDILCVDSGVYGTSPDAKDQADLTKS